MKDANHVDKNYPYGPVRKLQLLHVFAKHQKISGKEWAVIVVIADMSNATNGTAWPSFKYLALEANTSERNIASVIKNLRAKGILKVPTPGNRYRSNTYQLNFDLLTELPISTEENNSTLLINSSISTDEIDSEVLIDGSVKSIYQSEHEAKDKIDRELDTDTSPSRPLGASGLHLEKSLKVAFDDFWEIYPLKAGVYMAEKKLTELHKQTGTYSEILAGAKRYAEYCLAINSRPRPADQWLEAQRWRDSWKIAEIKKQSPKESKRYIRKVPSGLVINPNYLEWLNHPDGDAFEQVALEIEEIYDKKFPSHVTECNACQKAFKDGEFYGGQQIIENYYLEDLCTKGKKLIDRYDELYLDLQGLSKSIEKNNGKIPDDYYDFA
jgi:hypothetical protein